MRLSCDFRYVAVFAAAVASLTSSAPAQSQGPVLAEFPAAVGRVLPCVVRVLGEANPEKIRGLMAEAVVSADKKTYLVGSGFFISTDGRIVTANHVVAPITGDIVIETKYTGKPTQHKAAILAQDKHADVAILKIDGNGYPKVDMVDPLNVAVGESIGFAGYPRGFAFPMVNKGIISAKASMPLKQGLDATP